MTRPWLAEAHSDIRPVGVLSIGDAVIGLAGLVRSWLRRHTVTSPRHRDTGVERSFWCTLGPRQSDCLTPAGFLSPKSSQWPVVWHLWLACWAVNTKTLFHVAELASKRQRAAKRPVPKLRHSSRPRIPGAAAIAGYVYLCPGGCGHSLHEYNLERYVSGKHCQGWSPTPATLSLEQSASLSAHCGH